MLGWQCREGPGDSGTQVLSQDVLSAFETFSLLFSVNNISAGTGHVFYLLVHHCHLLPSSNRIPFTK